MEEANARYHNGLPTTMTDAEYDELLARLASADPDHPLLSRVGATPPSSSSDKVRLPFPMGSLDKIKGGEDGKMSIWDAKHGRASAVVVSDKLDGVSALVVVPDRKMYTRGDGIVGRDVSYLLASVRVPDYGEAAKAVRGELVIPKASFADVGATSGQHARNIVAGAVNAGIPNPHVLRHMEFVAYEIVSPAGLTPREQFARLTKNGGAAAVVHHVITPRLGDQLGLSHMLARRRSEGRHAVDGLVVAPCDQPYARRSSGTKKNQNYANAFAFKDGSTIAAAQVDRVEWSASKDGLMKPVVAFVPPVDLGGAVIRRATGFNAKFVVDNVLGPGAEVMVTRSGDVIPHILRVTRPARSGVPELPGNGRTTSRPTWSASGVDIRVLEGDDDDAVRVRRLEHFAKVMGMEGLRELTLRRLYDGGLTRPGLLVRATRDELAAVPGIGPRQADNIHASVGAAMKGADCLRLLHASNAFGPGFGERRLRDLTTAAFPGAADPAAAAVTLALSREHVVRERLTGRKEGRIGDAFVEGLIAFGRFQAENDIQCRAAPANEKKKKENDDLAGQSYVFSGFRDKELEERLRRRGADVKSAVSRTTTVLVVPDGGSSSSSTKVSAAKALGVLVVEKSALMARK